jgi:hypothetical protein
MAALHHASRSPERIPYMACLFFDGCGQSIFYASRTYSSAAKTREAIDNDATILFRLVGGCRHRAVTVVGLRHRPGFNRGGIAMPIEMGRRRE